MPEQKIMHFSGAEVNAAADPWFSHFEALQARVTAVTQLAEAEAKAPPMGDWRRLSELLLTIEHVRHAVTRCDTDLRSFLTAIDDDDISDEDWQTCHERSQRLGSLIQKLAAASNVIRPIFDRAIRPYIQPRNILDLPEEILAGILDHLKYQAEIESDLFFFADYHGRDKWSKRDVQNVRLTCRRFCEVGSPLLIHYVDVSLNRSSLARLDAISRHPTISKGIVALRVNLDMYTLSPPNEARFAENAWAQLDEEWRILQWQLSRWDEDPEHEIYSREEMDDTIQKYARIIESWQRYSELSHEEMNAYLSPPRGLENDGDKRARMDAAAVRECYKEYESLVREQFDVIRNRTFLKTIAAAMARMPTATRLSMTDDRAGRRAWKTRIPRFYTPMEKASNPYLLAREAMIATKSWQVASFEQRDEDEDEGPPLSLLHEIPLAIAKTGTALTLLDINVIVPHPTEFEANLRAHDISGLASIGRSLKALSYRNCGIPYWDTEAKWSKRLEYLRYFATGQKLQRLSIDVPDFVHTAHQQYMPMGSLLKPSLRVSGDLTVCTLDRCSFHLHELRAFLAQFRPNSLLIVWKNMLLSSGTWAEALEDIRATADWNSSLEGAYGGECLHMSQEEVNEIFGLGSSLPLYEPSKASQYISKTWGVPNPLVPTPVEDTQPIQEA